MQPCLYYHPEAFTTTGPKLMGRNAAGESFLRGFLEHARCDTWWVQVTQQAHALHFAQTVQAFGRTEPVKALTKANLGALARAGLLYLPGPGLAEHARHRAMVAGPDGHAAWSLCGITHTTSSAGAMDCLTDLIAEPVQPWDALICTSMAVQTNVKRVLQARVDELRDRLGLTKLVLPMTPVIPLGVHTRDFTFTADTRARARRELGVVSDAIVVLFMGRLSFHAKAHPLAMYQALERAARATGREVVLVECGWHANEHIRAAYQQAATLACPSIRVRTLDGRIPTQREDAWASADIFCSLSDNIQETFGITPIEAMAAGLPVVVSDWDGYKDTVRDGIDGFRIPTVMPPAGLGGDLAARHAMELDSYDMYCGHTCSLVAVDVEACTQAFVRLFQSPSLRAELGAAGRQRAIATYDWRVVVGQYEALWAQQDERRSAMVRAVRGGTVSPSSSAYPWPARLDPFYAFAHYATTTLTATSRLELTEQDVDDARARVTQLRGLVMVSFAQQVLPSEEAVGLVLDALVKGPSSVEVLLQAVEAADRPLIWRCLTWLLKLGVLRLIDADNPIV
jgi:starch synthase